MTLLVIAGMALITFILRFTPLLLSRNIVPRNGQLKSMLDHLPLAVLSALTVPGIYQVDPDYPQIGIVAGFTAVILVLLRKVPPLFVVLGSVAAAVILKFITLHF
jgi:branched-subunit amino acid transport protein